ncbi:hypothetical protein [Streptomyces sp. SCA2-2]|uniref:hypothetical protein n=1 Tax=Streptomyces sp. SCA2-2 TaxID=1563677 RepID=UPI00102281F0|nr:hypothetical protein C0L86_01430 [Streptomyces sp. SCA2-2]
MMELREADDAAAGGLLPAELDPAALAAAEQRANLLPERLARQVFQEPRQPVRRRAAPSAGRARRWA